MKEVVILKEPTGIINCPKDLFGKIQKIIMDYNQENFLVVFLDTKNRAITIEVMFKGGLNACLVDPKIIFKQALLTKANAIIVAHNHPSGDLEPSSEDMEIYKQLKKCGEILQLKVLDSIIFNKKEFYSMKNYE